MEHGLNAELAVVRAELRRTIEEQEILTAELEASEEELRVANSALQAKAELFEHLAAQLRNLLSSTRIIAIFLDSKLRVRWFTPDADHVVGLLPRDVGRPFADFTLRFTDPDLWRDAKRVLAAQGVSERDVPGQDGRWYARRILPYRSLDERPEGIVITFTEVTARKLAEARVEHLALHDVLTGLPNRTLFDDRLRQALARARRAGTSISLMTLDLDHFKVVNDTLGHPAGDRLLGEVAGRIGQVIRSSDTLARLGGDEFALVQGEVRQPGDVVALARKIVEAVARPFEVDGHQLHTGVSVGIAVWPEDGPTPAALLRSADLALYRAKESGRGRMCFFEPALQLRMEARRTLERELQQGIDRDELVLHFQPQLDLRTGRFAGVESLVRWQHPERGLLGPDEFIPIAETSGLIRPLGRWVLTAACSQARRWLDRGRLLRTAINISPIQARHPDLLQAIDDTLAAYGLDASLIGFEITEGTLLDLSDRVTTNLLEGLRTRGISLSLDDFGVGYSSLAYLRQIAVQQIKIDRSFISGIGQGSDAEALVGAIIGLGHALGKRVVAEGVETSAQLAFLRQLGCDEAQGYLLARPGTAEALAGLLGPAPREVPDH